MALDKTGKPLPTGITWVEKKKLYMGRFTYHGTPYTMYDKTLKGIQKKLAEKRYEAEHGLEYKAAKTTLNDWFEVWLHDYKLNKIKPTSRQNYENLYDCQLRNTLGPFYLSQIKPIQIQKVYNDFMAKGLSSKYLHCMNAILYNLFDMAVRNELLQKNPCDGVIKPPLGHTERRVLSLEEQSRFLRFIRQEQWAFSEPTLTVLLGTGMRVGELLGLNWEDLDFEHKTISISKTMVYVKNRDTGKFQFAVQTPKTRHGRRTIPMQKHVEQALLRQRALQQTLRTRPDWAPQKEFTQLVFCGRNGQPRQRTAIQCTLNRIVRAMNAEETKLARKEGREPVLMEHLHPHALRHSFATRCFEVDMPPKTVQQLLGHASIQMTMDLYTHVSEQKKMADMSRLDEIFSCV